MKKLLSRFLELRWMEKYRLLRPLRRHLHAPRLDRQSVARGVAVGIFFGILVPVAQIVFAVLVAISIRANVAVAAACTLVSNPLTFPFVYYFAFRIGAFLTGHDLDVPPADVTVSEEAAARGLEVATWYETLFRWLQSIGPPLAMGILVLALTSALVSFLLVHLCWRYIRALRAAARRRS
jgi:uncharacterized protein (DUF2062 family)